MQKLEQVISDDEPAESRVQSSEQSPSIVPSELNGQAVVLSPQAIPGSHRRAHTKMEKSLNREEIEMEKRKDDDFDIDDEEDEKQREQEEEKDDKQKAQDYT